MLAEEQRGGVLEIKLFDVPQNVFLGDDALQVTTHVHTDTSTLGATK